MIKSDKQNNGIGDLGQNAPAKVNKTDGRTKKRGKNKMENMPNKSALNEEMYDMNEKKIVSVNMVQKKSCEGLPDKFNKYKIHEKIR